ncbi:head-tail connector protein [Aliihoeflea sp. PC F10.4]
MKSVVVIEPPSPIVTFDETASHLRLDGDDERGYVEGLIAAAQGWIDGPAGILRRSVGPQLLEFRDDDPCSPFVALPYGPVLDIVEAWSGNDAVDVSSYRPGAPVFGFGIQMNAGQSIRVQYWAGYGKRDDAGDWVVAAPPPIKVAVMMLVAQWYMARAAVNIGNIVNEMPFAVDALLQPYRVYR